MQYIVSSNKSTDYKQTIAEFEKFFTCFCCCRAQVDGYFKGEDAIDVIGKTLMSQNIKFSENMGKAI